jgi:hypothetical protein
VGLQSELRRRPFRFDWRTKRKHNAGACAGSHAFYVGGEGFANKREFARRFVGDSRRNNWHTCLLGGEKGPRVKWANLVADEGRPLGKQTDDAAALETRSDAPNRLDARVDISSVDEERTYASCRQTNHGPIGEIGTGHKGAAGVGEQEPDVGRGAVVRNDERAAVVVGEAANACVMHTKKAKE